MLPLRRRSNRRAWWLCPDADRDHYVDCNSSEVGIARDTVASVDAKGDASVDAKGDAVFPRKSRRFRSPRTCSQTAVRDSAWQSEHLRERIILDGIIARVAARGVPHRIRRASMRIAKDRYGVDVNSHRCRCAAGDASCIPRAASGAVPRPPSQGAPMQTVNVYLNFPGTTDEAFRFYETVFGTRISMKQTFGETTFMPNVPEEAKNKIMHVQLPITETIHLMGSDAVPGFGPPLKPGNNFHVSIVAKDKAEADRAFAALSTGGSVAMPLGNAPWGQYFGMCVDRFGVQWMVSLPNTV
jgi:PhnB protein